MSENIDEVLFDDKEVEVTKGVKTLDVRQTNRCPICRIKKHIEKGNLKMFACGTIVDIDKKKLVNRCKYNRFRFYKESDYDPAKHYFNSDLDNLGIKITGVCMYHNYEVPLCTEGKHIKIYKKDGYLNLKDGELVGSALIPVMSGEVAKAVEQYVQDYNDIVVDKNIWSWDVVDNEGNLIDRLMGFFGNVYEKAKAYMSEYGIYEEDFDLFWEQREE